MARNNFLEKNQKQNSNTIKKVEPKMFPSRFRERSHLKQRVFLFLIVVFYALAIGVITFTLLSGLASKMFVLYYQESNFIILTMVLTIIMMFIGAIGAFVPKMRKFLVSDMEFISYILSPIIIIGSYAYLSYSFDFVNKKPEDLLFIIGISSAGAVIIPSLFNVFRLLISVKRWKIALKKQLLLLPGILVSSLPNLIIWFFAKDMSIFKLDLITTLLPIGAMGVGVIMLIIGVIISLKYDIKGTKNVWSNVRFTGGLTTLILYTALATIGFRFAKMEFPLVVEISLVANSIYLLAITLFVIFRGGIKNVTKMNPILNDFIIKLFIIIPLITTLGLIAGMPNISFVKDYGAPSFTILFITTITIIMGMLMLHMAKIITYSKFFKFSIASGFLSLFIILIIVFSITVLKNSNIIMHIIARQTVTLFIIFSLIFEVLGLFINVFYIITNVIIKETKDVKVKKQEEESRLAAERVGV